MKDYQQIENMAAAELYRAVTLWTDLGGFPGCHKDLQQPVKSLKMMKLLVASHTTFNRAVYNKKRING